MSNLKVVDVFEVGRDVFVGGVNEGLIQVDQQNQPPTLKQPALILTTEADCFIVANLL